ncbi:YiiX/YebB-like N1pC/P60 family cysteine hydrolase [Arenicella xantha]|uniref:Permuted papain-like amidase YaeF/Yiix C92 family enzyme n=1 Tax=Arenicella xantha TaxID=644221 RepID=A0A395JRA0_9GAMM|nr:YiiX/YebB-like N1pC/P60 family cysteine hydrolase [Arenicella xantha]RBP52852.1 permuted papain-like amidase YaeF/Yiix C92 family enzyme [Arenicella xantha]
MTTSAKQTAELTRLTQALVTLNESLPQLFKDAFNTEKLAAISSEGLFSPQEDEQMGYWFARFITIRRNLWSIVEAGIQTTGGISKLSAERDYPFFVLAYSAVCSLIRMDRFLVGKVATHTIIQRKLNEALPQHRIERKQFSEIYQALVQPANALRIHQAHRTLKRHAETIQLAVRDSPVESVLSRLPQQERYLNLSRRHYFLAWLKSRKLVWRRRGASAKQKSLFTVLEYSGRLASELSLPRPKKVTPTVRDQLAKLIQPGDIFITRHSRALTNLFLPGYWPHAALYVGYEHDRDRLQIPHDPIHHRFWCESACTLEALKDGVHFRSLASTLSVDAFVVIRPNFSQTDIAQALGRVAVHAGKAYNFDFDFFRADQLVCTEVIYRAFDGIAGRRIPLHERVGRKTLSAEDILDLTIESDWAQAIAIFGVGDSKHELITDHRVNAVLQQSYR